MDAIDRRQNLKILATTGAAMLTGACFRPSMSNAVNDPIAIIGAGVAGLSAARHLIAQGHRPIIVEARNRIGGRIHTSRLWPDLPVDLGASWIHGTKNNPITALAKAAGMASVATSYDSAKLHIDPALAAIGVKDRATRWVEGVVTKAISYADHADVDIALHAAVDHVSPPGGRTKAQQAQLAFHLSSNFEQEYGGSIDRLSAQTIEESEEFGGLDVLFPSGYDALCHHLAQGIDIRLNQQLVAVDWGNGHADLLFSDHSRLRARRVIITVPLGVLKADRIRFNPALPDEKRAAITRLDMGLLNKHFLRFERVFWPPQFDWHEFIHDTPGDWAQWVSLAKINDTPVLLGFSGADTARALETKDDKAIIGDAADALRTMFGSATPAPVAAQITRWSQDAFTYGAYSFNAVNSTPQDRQALARPVGAMAFAGEAASARYPGTVHGAWLSGREAAQAILTETGHPNPQER